MSDLKAQSLYPQERQVIKANDFAANTATEQANLEELNETKAERGDLVLHVNNTNNPHSVTKSQVGLGNVTDFDTTNASNITTGTLDVNRLPSSVLVNDSNGKVLSNQYVGDMYLNNGAISTAITVAGTYYSVGAGLLNSIATGFTFSNSALTCVIPGKYLITFDVSVYCATATQSAGAGLMKNGIVLANSINRSLLTTASQLGSLGSSVIVSLVAGDIITLGLTNATATNPIVSSYANLTALRISS